MASMSRDWRRTLPRATPGDGCNTIPQRTRDMLEEPGETPGLMEIGEGNRQGLAACLAACNADERWLRQHTTEKRRMSGVGKETTWVHGCGQHRRAGTGGAPCCVQCPEMAATPYHKEAACQAWGKRPPGFMAVGSTDEQRLAETTPGDGCNSRPQGTTGRLGREREREIWISGNCDVKWEPDKQMTPGFCPFVASPWTRSRHGDPFGS